MSKKALRSEQEIMTDSAIVDEASRWADALVQSEYRGPGDTIEAAMYRKEQKTGVSFQTFWALRYRKPKDMLASVFFRLKAAYDHECARQEARLQHELEMLRKVRGDAPDTPAIRAAEALVGETAGHSSSNQRTREAE